MSSKDFGTTRPARGIIASRCRAMNCDDRRLRSVVEGKARGIGMLKGRCERGIGSFRPWIRIAALVAVLALPVTVLVQSGPEPAAGRGWSTVMGDLGNRHSTLDQI